MSLHDPEVEPGSGDPQDAASQAVARARAQAPRYGRYAGLLALLIVVLITINTVVTKPNGGSGIAPGQSVPPFAVPLALGSLKGDADIATEANEGARGNVPACKERGPQILNVCQLFERGPVVLALFVAAGSCPAILSDLEALTPSFPGVQFAAVAIKGERASVRRLILSRGVHLPVGLDSDGALAALYKVASCPQVTFAYPGGVVQSRALLSRPSGATLRARVAELVAAARARGWKGPTG
jgi:hypothetical protein